MNDGSAKNRRMARDNTLGFAKKLVGALSGGGKKVYVVCCEPGAVSAFGKGAADVRSLSAKNLPPVKPGDVQVVVTPVRASVGSLLAAFCCCCCCDDLYQVLGMCGSSFGVAGSGGCLFVGLGAVESDRIDRRTA